MKDYLIVIKHFLLPSVFYKFQSGWLSYEAFSIVESVSSFTEGFQIL